MPEPTDPTPNLPLLRKVLAHIDAHPQEWDQGQWGLRTPCGTVACTAGHALLLSGAEVRWSPDGWLTAYLDPDGGVDNAARVALGLTPLESWDLFRGVNDRADVQRVAERIAARAGEAL